MSTGIKVPRAKYPAGHPRGRIPINDFDDVLGETPDFDFKAEKKNLTNMGFAPRNLISEFDRVSDVRFGVN